MTVLTALLLIPLMLLAALAVDVGGWYHRGMELQRAADAAAMAGTVFMPEDPDQAIAAALATARRNGLRHGYNGVSVQVEAVTGAPHDLRVTITDSRVRTFFGAVVVDDITMSRTARATYTTPVPMGSPRNYLGVGTLFDASAPVPSDQSWLAINGGCTWREHGDPYAPLWNASTDCSTGTANPTHQPVYEFAIELPQNRTDDVDVVIYDGPTSWPSTLHPTADYWPWPGPPRPMYNGYDGSQRFTLYAPDDTPTDNDDNPTMASTGGCRSAVAGENGTKTFHGYTHYSLRQFRPLLAWVDPLINNYTYTGTGLARTDLPMWNLCRIPSTAPAGTYILRVGNVANGNTDATGVLWGDDTNTFSLMAIPASNPRFCSTVADATCPSVHGVRNLSLSAIMETDGVTDAYLASIDAGYSGRPIDLTVYDFEPGQTLELMRPTGPDTWVPASFTWTSTNGQSSSGTVTSFTSDSSFNAQDTTFRVNLPPDYDPGANSWWKVRYTSTFAGDRTTWTVGVDGHPVHLVE